MILPKANETTCMLDGKNKDNVSLPFAFSQHHNSFIEDQEVGFNNGS